MCTGCPRGKGSSGEKDVSQGNAHVLESGHHAAATPLAPPICDCCGSSAWRLAFAADGMHLGRCAECGLHYVAEMPTQAQRVQEMSERKFGKGGHVLEASKHLAGETIRRKEFQHYVDLARTHAPPGSWLDLGCGTGVLMQCAEGAGQAIEGIELTPDRREATSRLVRGHIYDQPLELLDLPSASYAAIFMINVFSHLVRPSIIVAEILRVLRPGGVLGGAYQRDRRRGSALAQVGLESGHHLTSWATVPRSTMGVGSASPWWRANRSGSRRASSRASGSRRPAGRRHAMS